MVVLNEKLALDWVDGSDMTNGLLGMLLRMALSMGLHRDPEMAADLESGDVQLRRNVSSEFSV
jgi:hypothetical protein